MGWFELLGTLSGRARVRRLTGWWNNPFGEAMQIRQLRRSIEAETEHRVILHANGRKQDGWISAEENLLDPREHASLRNFFQRSSLQAMLAERVWERWSLEQGRSAARNSFQYLEPGGYLRVAVSDGFHPSPSYLERERPHGDSDTENAPRVLYNYVSLSETFAQAGFHVQLIEYFDEEGVFHSNPWDVSKGVVRSSLLFEKRHSREPYEYTSLILDAVKPDAAAMGIPTSVSQGFSESIEADKGSDPLVERRGAA